MTDLTAVQRPISDLPVTAKISIPGSPDWVGIGPNAVWISNAGRNSLARIDPAENKIVKTVPVGRRPCSGLAIGFDDRLGAKLPGQPRRPREPTIE